LSTNDTANPGQSPDADSAEEMPQQEKESPRRQILIGSQRDPAAYQAPRKRDWEPIVEPDAEPDAEAADGGKPSPGDEAKAAEVPAASPAATAEAPGGQAVVAEEPQKEEPAPVDPAAELDEPPKGAPVGRIPPPSVRDQLSPDLEAELSMAIDDSSLEELIAGDETISKQPILEEESRHTGRVVAVRNDDLFVELGSREQGVLSSKQFEEMPEVGAELDVIVRRFIRDDGLYELILPDAAASVGDWDDLREGMLVDVLVTGHNTGGLECEVNHIRGFIPISQIALYRVEDLAEFVDQKFTCLVTEANPQRRNPVLSRRAVLEREKEEARQEFLESLAPGQIHEGVVRKILHFGAFVDIGGLDGLLHISQLAWYRVEHPSEILKEGQTIKVKIEKIDRATGKMSLGYREMLENPWSKAEQNYPPNSIVKGKVSKLMEFGAFVEVERGIEGLVHISELSHKHVRRPGDVVHEGDEIEVLVLSVDPEAQRMSLSLRQTMEPEPEEQKVDEPESAPGKPAKPKRKGPSKPLKGGLGRSGGESTGLQW